MNDGQTTAYDINDSGVVVGGGASGFWISNGVVSPFPGGTLFGINDANLAVGTVAGIAVTYNRSVFTNLDALLGLNVGPPIGLNNSGQIVGEYHPDQSESYGFIATPINTPADTTPPPITPHIPGTLGNNGWYRSRVTVTWTVTDPESGVASSQGCGQTVLSSDTPGITLTCSATNGAGLTSSSSVAIKIDQTPPIIGGMPAAGCTIWPPNKQLITVATVTATDALSGIAAGSFQITGLSNEPHGNPQNPEIVIVPNGLGEYIIQLQADRLGVGTGRVYTLTATASDLAGNTAMVTASCTVPHDQGQ